MIRNLLKPPEKDRSAQEHKAVPVSTDTTAVQDTWRNIRLIVEREYKNQVTRRSFIISTIILLVVVALAAFIPAIIQLITESTKSQTQVVVVNNAGIIAGLDDTKLFAYINSDLNGANTTGKPPYVITIKPSTNLDNGLA